MMACSALNRRIPTQRFIAPPLTPPAASVTIKLTDSKIGLHPLFPSLLSIPSKPLCRPQKCNSGITSCLNSSSSDSPPLRTRLSPSTRLYVSGLSFRTTEESLRNAFQNFGDLVEVKLAMDRIANRSRGFAFLRYTAEEEAKKAIEGMHGKFLDGRVIFVEFAKSRTELRQQFKQKPS